MIPFLIVKSFVSLIICWFIFDKFDYVDGGLKSEQVSYWDITDDTDDGTWYYAISAYAGALC